MDTQNPIHVVAIGYHRGVLEMGMVQAFANAPCFKLVAILDLEESPLSLQYTPQNLAVVLNALYPRPRVLITGTAILDEMLPQIESVWNDYATRHEVDGLYLAMSKTHPSPGAPPPPGAIEYAIATLNEKFMK
ncbi:hypothetical protein N0V93_004877 [Gnomoniopsis smithogilvyi]|uniref:Uncharacterized protein n=1 Tax=Gnomoniopsis smithogilvyi TaxID=1191159 RepID=A0A9W8YTG8_9PEZI|nr:hypothetical protein N0V93_004877 [Gnomoniopsis smithogilvyi]